MRATNVLQLDDTHVSLLLALAFSAYDFAIIGQSGAQHPVNNFESQLGIEASSGIVPITKTITLATSFDKMLHSQLSMLLYLAFVCDLNHAHVQINDTECSPVCNLCYSTLSSAVLRRSA